MSNYSFNKQCQLSTRKCAEKYWEKSSGKEKKQVIMWDLSLTKIQQSSSAETGIKYGMKA